MPDDAEGPSRRSSDLTAAQTGFDVALLRQAVELGAKATEAQFTGLSRAIDGLGVKMDAVKESQSEPGASPAGRQLLEKWTEHEKRLTEHEGELAEGRQFRSEILGGIKTLRTQVAVVGFILGIVAGLDAIVTIVKTLETAPHP